jgi:hypothetical protein
MTKISHLLIFFLQTVILSAAREPPLKCQMTNLACDYDQTICKDVVCRYKSARSIFGIFNFGITLLKPLDKIKVDILVAKTFFQRFLCGNFQIAAQSYVKNSANRWIMGSVRIAKTDVCNLNKNNYNFLMIIDLFGGFSDILQTCPYKVKKIFYLILKISKTHFSVEGTS